MITRSDEQKLWDQILLLRLAEAVVANKSTIDGNLKAQKLGFLVELRTQLKGFKGPHYRFFRYAYGPFSKDIKDDLRELEDVGFLTKNSRVPTDRGRYLSEYVFGALEQDGTLAVATPALEAIDSVAQEYGRKGGMSLKDLVYQMKVPVQQLGEQMKVIDVPTFVDILDPNYVDGLVEIQPLSEELISDIRDEFAYSPEDVQPGGPRFKDAAKRFFERASA